MLRWYTFSLAGFYFWYTFSLAYATCMPVKLCYGHVEELISQGVETIFIPAELEQLSGEKKFHSFHCPYIQGAPYMINASFSEEAEIITTAVYMSGERENIYLAMKDAALKLGAEAEIVEGAIDAALKAQSRFKEACIEAGQIALNKADPKFSVVLLGKPHHLFDDGQNMKIISKLRNMGITAIPFDYLPLHEVELPESWDNTVWKNNREMIKAAILAVELGLPTIMLSSFGCGPDSFLCGYLEEILCGHPHLQVEIDEHTADGGLLTRLEAFWDTVQNQSITDKAEVPEVNVVKYLQKSAPPLQPSKKLLSTLKGRTLYIPHLCEGLNKVLSAALNAGGINAECLPPQDETVEELGRKHTKGNECHPYIFTVGDLVKLTDRPDFNPERAAFFMLNYDGACRLSQFAHSQKIVLQQMGIGEVPVVAPITGIRSEEFTKLFGMNITQAFWKGLLATEFLIKYLSAIRPYELEAGAADAVYKRGLEKITSAVAGGSSYGGYIFDRHLIDVFRGVLTEMNSVPVRKTRDLPRIGIVGEFFTELNEFANQNLIRRIEALGAEVVPQGFTLNNVLMYYYGHYYSKQKLRNGRLISAFYNEIIKRWLFYWSNLVHSFEEKVDENLSRMIWPREIKDAVQGHIHGDIDPISSLSVARFKDFMKRDVDGICWPIVLNCMLGNMVQPIFQRIAGENGGMPLLVASFDGLKQTNLQNRLEAFVDQANIKRNKKKWS